MHTKTVLVSCGMWLFSTRIPFKILPMHIFLLKKWLNAILVERKDVDALKAPELHCQNEPVPVTLVKSRCTMVNMTFCPLGYSSVPG